MIPYTLADKFSPYSGHNTGRIGNGGEELASVVDGRLSNHIDAFEIISFSL